VSIGTAACVAGATAQHLLQEADLSMYGVKAAGRTLALPAA
jgi:GGDEF domain-containing protein